MKRFLLYVFVLIINFGFGQNYNFKRLSVEEGLSQPGLYSVSEGPEGYLWIGLENAGVVKFDGWSFSSIDIDKTGIDIRCIYKTSEDEMWVGSSYDGISVFDQDSILNISTDKGLLSNHIRAITEDVTGDIWVATMGGGISVFSDKEKVHQFNINNGLPSPNSRTIISTQDGKVYAGTDNGVAVFDHSELQKVYTQKNGLLGSKILSLAEDKNGNIWIGSTKGLNVITKDSIYSFNKSNLLKQNRIKSILVDDKNMIWLGSKEGVGCLNYDGAIKNGIQVKWFTEENGLSNNRIRCLFQDQSKAIWIGTYFGGVNRFFNSKFSLTTKSNGLSNNAIRSVNYFKQDSSYWLGTFGAGLDIINSHGKLNISEDQGLSNNTVSSICEIGKGKALIGTDAGLNLIENGEVMKIWDTYSYMFEGDKINNVLASNNHGVILTDKHELVAFNLLDTIGIDRTLTKRINDEIKDSLFLKEGFFAPIKSISKTKNVFWLGTHKRLFSLKIIDSNSIRIQGVDLSDVECIASFHNGLLGYDTHDSLFVLNNSNQLIWKKKFNSISNIKFLIKHNVNSYWVGQNKSITNLIVQKDSIVEIKNYGIEEGFLGVQPFHNSAVLSNSGDLLVGCIKGLLKVDSSSYKGVKRDLKVKLKGVLLDGDQKDWSNYADAIENGIPTGLKLKHNHVNLTFQVSAMHLKNPQEIDFKYQLMDWDDEYKMKSAKALKSDNGLFNIDYEHIAPGEYELIVYAKTPHGEWSSKPLKYSFEILPVWWKTPSFIISSILVIIGLIVFLIMYRTERLLKEKLKLEGLVQDRTKDLNEEKVKSEKLLLNILPAEIALELKTFGLAKTKKYQKASVLFTDFKGFTKLSTELTAVELVEKLDEIFVSFDEVIERNYLEKIKTIGDAYMCASGVPNENEFQVRNIVIAGLQLVEAMRVFNEKQKSLNKPIWDVRVGIHTGEIIAGVVGKKKFAYDVWGDAVNIASRMESNSEPGRVNVSASTYLEVEQYFEFEKRGFIEAKNRGELEMFFVNRIKEEFCKKGSSIYPNQSMFKRE